MKTKDFLRSNNACVEGARWALSISNDMADVWEAMIKEDNSDKDQRLLWTATREGVFPEAVLRRMACRFVRETTIPGGRTLWDLLEDKRSRKAVMMVEAYVDGKATTKDLKDASKDAYLAAMPAYSAEYAAYIASSVTPVGGYTAAHAADVVANGAVDAASEEVILGSWNSEEPLSHAIQAARAVALSSQARIIASFGNPFK